MVLVFFVGHSSFNFPKSVDFLFGRNKLAVKQGEELNAPTTPLD